MTNLLKLPNLCRLCRRKFFTTSTNLDETDQGAEIPAFNYFAPRQLRNYFQTNGLTEDELAKIPESYAKKNILAKSFMIACPKTAKTVGFTIGSRVKGKYVLEFGPGIGLISEILLMAAPNLRLYEQNRALSKALREKFKGHIGNKVRIFDKNLNTLSALLQSEEAENQAIVTSLFEDIPLEPWNENISISFVLHAFHKKTIRFLLYNLILDNRLKQYGRPELFILLNDSLYECIAARPDNEYAKAYRQLPVLFQIFFTVESLLIKLPRKAFLPWPSETRKHHDDAIRLVCLTPKTEMCDPLRSCDFVEIFLMFTKSFLRKRKPVIATLEQFVPNCGPQFILEDDITTYTDFLELPPEKILSIFQRLLEYPEFDPAILRSYDYQDGVELVYDNDDREEGI